MEELPGIRQGSLHFHYQRYCYHRDSRHRDHLHYVCVKKADRNIHCNATLSRNLGRGFDLRGEHNHAADPLCYRRREMRNELLRAAVETNASANEIFDAVSIRYYEL